MVIFLNANYFTNFKYLKGLGQLLRTWHGAIPVQSCSKMQILTEQRFIHPQKLKPNHYVEYSSYQNRQVNVGSAQVPLWLVYLNLIDVKNRARNVFRTA